ncbi:MAG TPA: hypothetical protein VFF98_06070 [Novosphingobium sp.]|nr:hypothetical protein [Novosphingobium sp.]
MTDRIDDDRQLEAALRACRDYLDSRRRVLARAYLGQCMEALESQKEPPRRKAFCGGDWARRRRQGMAAAA